MTWKERLASNLLFRNMLSDKISYPASAAKKTFTPYFQYKIGKYQRDYHLYFTNPPNSIRYSNDIFNKLSEYDVYEIVQYIEFHFMAFESKEDFLRFLRYETNMRLKLNLRKSFKMKLETVLDWLLEKQEESQIMQQVAVKADLKQELYRHIEKEMSKGDTLKQSGAENITKDF